MATQSTTYGEIKPVDKISDSEQQLKEIISEIHHYLYNFGHHWLFLAIGRLYFQKCCHSWVRVSTHLEKFLRDPRSNYSLLMIVLDHEIQKFPRYSFYAKQLRSLERLISHGPRFSR